MVKVIKLSLACLLTLFLVSCSTCPHRPKIATRCGYTFFPRHFYGYQSYPLFNPYYPYGYPYYVDRPMFWENQNWFTQLKG